MSLTFVSNNGTTWPFDGSTGVTMTAGDEGIFDIPVDLAIDQRVGADGGTLVQARRAPRTVVLNLMIENASSVLPTWGSLMRAFAAGGSLVHTGVNGTRRLRQVNLSVPGRGRTGYDLNYRPVDVFSVVLVALDPWWYGDAESTSRINLAVNPTQFDDATVLFDDALTPFNGGTSITLLVEGDAPASPWIVIDAYYYTGNQSVDSVVVGNGTVDWEMIRPLVGRVFEVNTFPGLRGPHLGSMFTPHDPVNPVDWSWLSERSRLFDLPVGSTVVTFGAVNPSANVTIRFGWESRWLTP